MSGHFVEMEDMVKDCGVENGSALYVRDMLLGGGIHTSKKRDKQKQHGQKRQPEQEQTMEMDIDSVIQQLRAWGAFHEAVVGLSSDGRHRRC